MIDIGKGWRPPITRSSRSAAWRPYRPHWVEEPLPPDDIAGYRAARRRGRDADRAGEEETTRWDFRAAVHEGRVEIVQPDVTRCRRDHRVPADRREARDAGRRRCVLHAWSTGIIKAATMHVLAAMEDAEIHRVLRADD